MINSTMTLVNTIKKMYPVVTFFKDRYFPDGRNYYSEKALAEPTKFASSGYTGAKEFKQDYYAAMVKSLKETNTSFNIVSKYPRCDRDVRTTFEKSIANLGVDYLYGYLVHHFDFYQEKPEQFDDMIALKNEGKIQKVGFSLYTVDQLQYLLDHDVKFDILQFPYNLQS